MIRFLGKWSLEITGASILAYHQFVSFQTKSHYYGMYKSARNSFNFYMYFRTAFPKYQQLLELELDKSQTQLEIFHKQNAEQLSEIVSKNQGLYRRIVQYLLKDNQLLSEDYKQSFTQLKGIKAQPYQQVKKWIQKCIGQTMKQTFDSFKKQPVRIHPFFQQYKGILEKNFTQIILKVKQPHLQKQVERDFEFLYGILEGMQSKLQKHEEQLAKVKLFKEKLHQIEKYVSQQLNFEKEMQNSKAMDQAIRANLKLNNKIAIPYVYPELTNKNLLVRLDFEGTPLSKYKKLTLKQKIIPPNELKTLLKEYYSTMKAKRLLNCSMNTNNAILKRTIIEDQGVKKALNHLIFLQHGVYEQDSPYFEKAWSNIEKCV